MQIVHRPLPTWCVPSPCRRSLPPLAAHAPVPASPIVGILICPLRPLPRVVTLVVHSMQMLLPIGDPRRCRPLPRAVFVVVRSTRGPPCEQLLAAVGEGARSSVVGIGVGIVIIYSTHCPPCERVLYTPTQVYVDSHWTPCTIHRLYIDSH
jgi:hypothetical protein